MGRVVFCVLALLTLPASSHDFFENQTSPETGFGCCNKSDCRAAEENEVRFNQETENYEVLIHGTWWQANDPRWFKGPAPDHRTYFCKFPGDHHPRCVWISEVS